MKQQAAPEHCRQLQDRLQRAVNEQFDSTAVVRLTLRSAHAPCAVTVLVSPTHSVAQVLALLERVDERALLVPAAEGRKLDSIVVVRSHAVFDIHQPVAEAPIRDGDTLELRWQVAAGPAGDPSRPAAGRRPDAQRMRLVLLGLSGLLVLFIALVAAGIVWRLSPLWADAPATPISAPAGTPASGVGPASTPTSAPVLPTSTARPGVEMVLRPTLPPAQAAPSATPLPLFEGPFEICRSAGGRPLAAYRLGNGPSARAIIGGIHGGYEWNTVELVSQTLQYLRDHPAEIPADVTLYVVPNANPDGYARSWDLAGRENGNGVDLNRNWDYRWQPVGYHGSREVSAGSAPFSEPETQALRDFIVGRQMEAVVFYHSASAAVFSGAVYTNCATRELADALAAATDYEHRLEGIYGQVTTGDAIDWLSTVGIAGAEIELTDHQNVEFERNLRGVQAFLQWELPRQPPASAVELQPVGQSVEGRAITATRVGGGHEVALVIVGSIHGDERATHALVAALAAEYESAPDRVPPSHRLYFIPTMNPDGLAADTRYNARNVDLNRNWPTTNWQADAARGQTTIPGSGGSAPGSEPEVQAVAAWLEQLRGEIDEIYVVFYHSPYAGGLVLPGYFAPGQPGQRSDALAYRVAGSAGYGYLTTYPSELEYTGEAINWCVEHDIAAADVELPDSEGTHLETHRQVLADLLQATPLSAGAAGLGETGGAVPASGCRAYHEVEPGETLSEIALDYGTTVEALVSANGLASELDIWPGDRLCIPR